MGVKIILILGVFGIFLQTARSQENTKVYSKVLVIGDSITSHGPAVENLGWSGSWGMAASALEKDYVHLFIARLVAAQSGKMPKTMIGGGGGGKLTDKLTQLAKYKEFGADLLIVQMGENDNKDVSVDGFQKPYEQILEAVRAGNPNVNIFCFSTWGPPTGNAKKDAFIQSACKKYNGTFVSLRKVNADPDNMVKSEKRFSHPGVNWHPGDKGMQGYADALWEAFIGKNSELFNQADDQSKELGLIFRENWGDSSNLRWSPMPQVENVGGKPVMMTTLTDSTRQQLYEVVLPAEKIRSRKLVIETRIKGESLSAKVGAESGIHLGLKLLNAEGQLSTEKLDIKQDNSFDWTDAKWTILVPDNIVESKLQIGLVRMSGTVWFDLINISIQP